MTADAVPDAALLDEADVFRAADAWQVEGFSVWDAVKVQIAAETPEPMPVRADALGRVLYETALPETNDSNAALFALVQDLQTEVVLLRREVETLRRLQTAPPLPPRPVSLSLRRTYTPPLFPLTTPGD